MNVRFFYVSRSFSLGQRTRLKAFIGLIFRNEKQAVQYLNVIFCSDEYLLEINRQFLDHDFYTDIITFNVASSLKPICGDIYISVDRVRENAVTLGLTVKAELHRVIFHGVLHLCGYKDKKPGEIKTMRAKEDHYLQLYFKRST